MFMIGLSIALLAAFMIIMMIAAGIDMALRDRDDERAYRMAEEWFEDIIENAEIHVVQRMIIKDETKGGKE